MNCINHADVASAAFCIRCGHALCPECIRNVRGSVYCETCLAEMVGGASAGSPNTAPGAPATPKKTVVGTSPGAAFALGLIPGVGAIYNGDFLKAAIHVLIFGVLIQLNDSAGRFGEPLFGLATFAFYMYMAFEAYYTSKKRKLAAEGIDLETPIDQFHRQFGEVKDKELWGGVALIVIGAIFLADNFDIIHFERIGELWPLLLVALGIWMLKRYQGKPAS
jgi:hypothetical protein